MQLFSLGLWQLNDDGTRIIDANGDYIPTYTQHDVTTLSRAWTGFELWSDRGNTEPDSRGNRPSFIDAMLIRGDWRDPFPKTNMIGGYVGDGLPVCSELPERAWLRKGATWSYLGTSTCPQKHFERRCDLSSMRVDRVYLNETESALFAALCRPDGGGPDTPPRCQFRNEITLLSHLGCNGLECELDVVKVVGLKGAGLRRDGTPFDVYFEYLQPPCVERPFIVAPIVVTPRTGMYEHQNFARETGNQWPMCADPRVAHHAVGCCTVDDDDGFESGKGFHLYTHERATLATATARCAAMGQRLCDLGGTLPGKIGPNGNLGDWEYGNIEMGKTPHFSDLSPHTRRVIYPTPSPCLFDADWCLQSEWCDQFTAAGLPSTSGSSRGRAIRRSRSTRTGPCGWSTTFLTTRAQLSSRATRSTAFRSFGATMGRSRLLPAGASPTAAR